MKKELILYSLAIGLNRGAVLLYMPFLVHALSLVEYGEFSYIQILFQLLFPILCLNIPAGIAREGAEDHEKGLYVYLKIYPLVIVATFVFAILSFFIGKLFNYNYLVYIVLLGGVEALHNMQLNTIRTYDEHYIYSTYTASKTIGFLILIYIATCFYKVDLQSVLIIQIVWHLFIFIFFSIFFFAKKKLATISSLNLKPILLFSVFLIPHIVSQWLMGASNRIIVKNILGGEVMGIYSISYTISMVMLLFNSGLAIVIPQNFIKNPDLWLSYKFKLKFFAFYSVISLFIFLGVIAFLYINKHYIKVINYGNYPVAFYFSILTSSFYILGYYYYYANILFYYKKSKWISYITITVAALSIMSGYLLTKYFGIIGACISMLIAYVLYYIMVFCLAMKIEVRLSFDWFSDLIVPLLTVIIIILGGYYFSLSILGEILFL